MDLLRPPEVAAMKEQRQLEQEHEWREILQIQLGNHWLKLYSYPEEKKEPILTKMRNPEGQVA